MAASAVLLSLALGARALSAAPPANTFAFKAQVIHDRLGPMKRYTVMVDGKPTATDDGGVFEVPLAKGTTHVFVGLSGSSYVVHYPYGGFVAVPRDLNDLPQIVVGNPKESDYLKQYLGLYQLMKKSAAPAGEVRALNQKMADLESLLLRLHYSESYLQTARQIQDRRDDYFPEITADLIEYRTRANDLRTAFKYTADFAFENPNALQKLQEAVVNYNSSYNKLEKQRMNYEKRIADYWQNDALRAEFHQLMILALDQVHLGKIYPMQAVIGDINRYFLGKRDKDLKRQLQADLIARGKDLEVALLELDSSTNKVLADLTK